MKYLTKTNTKLKADSTKLILFDIDQTLIKVFDFHEKSLAKAFKDKFNVKASYFDIDFEGQRDIKNLKKLGEVHNIQFSEKELNQFAKFRVKVFKKMLPEQLDKYLLPGVKKLLEELSKQHILGVITGNSKRKGELIINRTSIKKYFKIFCYSDEANTRAEMIAKAINKAKKYKFNEVIVIGDSTRDIDSGKANNTKTIAVNTGHQTKTQLLKHHPDLLVENLEDKKVLEFINE